MNVSTRISGYLARAREKWYILRFRRLETCVLDRLELDTTNQLRVPIRCGGRGELKIGARNIFGVTLAERVGNGCILLQPRSVKSSIIIGDSNHFSNNIFIIANQNVTIGNDCRIGSFVSILDHDGHEIEPRERNLGEGLCRPVIIGDNVWIGSRSMILKGVAIGDNTVVGAMSLVSRSLPANCVAAGIPARVIRYFE